MEHRSWYGVLRNQLPLAPPKPLLAAVERVLRELVRELVEETEGGGTG